MIIFLLTNNNNQPSLLKLISLALYIVHISMFINGDGETLRMDLPYKKHQ